MVTRRTLVLTLLAVTAYTAAARQADTRREAFGAALRARADTLVAAQHAYVDSLSAHGAIATTGALGTLQATIDSLVRASWDSLDGESRTTIRFTELGMRTTIGVMGYPVRGAIHDLLGAFDRQLHYRGNNPSVFRPSDTIFCRGGIAY